MTPPSLNSCPCPVPPQSQTLSHLKYDAPTRNCHSAPGQAGKRALGSNTAGSAPRKEGITDSPEKQGMNEAESTPRQQQVSLQKCCCWARNQQGRTTGTAIMKGNITQKNHFFANQDLLFKSKDKAVGDSHSTAAA